MKDIFVRPFLTGAACALALLFGVAAAHASRLGVVSFANGSTHPTKIPPALIAQAQAAARGHGRVILLRGGASPVGSRSYNFVLSGERTAAIRDDLVAAGIPRKKIVSQYVGIVRRGSASADRAVIIDATTRQALGLAPATAGEATALRRLEAQVQALEAASHAKPKVAPAAVKTKAHPAYTGSAWYATRTTQANSMAANNSFYPNSGISTTPTTAGDNYQSSGYGFSLRERRPVDFNFWTPYEIPLQFSVAGLSQKWQVSNPVLSGTENWAPLGTGILVYPINTRDAVSTQFLHGSIQSPWNIMGLTVTPGIKIGWLGEQSLSGGETSVPFAGCTPALNGGFPCPTVTTATTQAAGGSAISVTPSLSIGGQGWQIGYSQSPWGGYGYHAPRVLMGTVAGRRVSLSMGFAFPDCPMCSQNGATISLGKIVKVGVHGYGWGAGLIYVAGEQFAAGGIVMPATLAQGLAPYNPAHPWNSCNPGLTLSVSKRLTKNVNAMVTYSYESAGGGGYAVPFAGLVSSQTNAVTKTTELSLRGRF